MADIKSAFEIAMEKASGIGEATPEERLSWKYIPEGEKLAAQFLKDDTALAAEVAKYEENVRKYILKGVSDVLIRNITLPKNDAAKKTNRRVMEALKTIKKDKVGVENIFSKMRQLFSHYSGPGEEQRKDTYDQLRISFTQRMQQALKQQGVTGNVRLNIESQPEFQAEWRKMSGQLDGQYLKHLDEYRQELNRLP